MLSEVVRQLYDHNPSAYSCVLSGICISMSIQNQILLRVLPCKSMLSVHSSTSYDRQLHATAVHQANSERCSTTTRARTNPLTTEVHIQYIIRPASWVLVASRIAWRTHPSGQRKPTACSCTAVLSTKYMDMDMDTDMDMCTCMQRPRPHTIPPGAAAPIHQLMP